MKEQAEVIQGSPAIEALAKLVCLTLGLSADWRVFTIKDADSLPKRRGMMASSTAVSFSAAWPPSQSKFGYPVPFGCHVLVNHVLSGHEKAEALIELLIAGWWCYYDDLEQGRAFLLPRPEVKMKNENVHCETGPAVIWPDKGAAHEYYLEGVRVPKKAIEEPAKLPDLAISHENAEVRRVLTNLYGHEKLMKACGRVVQEDEFGKLWQLALSRSDSAQSMVEVANSTPEPDGTYRRYMLRVPSTMKTAKEAVAWTFGMTEKQYSPKVQT